VTPKADAVGTGVYSVMDLGGGALDVNLGSAWSDYMNCGCSREGLI